MESNSKTEFTFIQQKVRDMLITRNKNVSVLPFTVNKNNIKCRDFDFNKMNCLYPSHIKNKKADLPLNYPINEENNFTIMHDTPIHTNYIEYKVCDMV